MNHFRYPFATLTLLLLLLAPDGSGQSFDGNQKVVYDKFMSLAEMNDTRAMQKIASENREDCGRIYEALEQHMMRSDTEEDWAGVKMFGDALDGVDGGNEYALRMKLVRGMTIEQRRARHDARVEYYDQLRTLRTAIKNRENEVRDEAVKVMETLAETFKGLGDVEHQCYCLGEVAQVLDHTREYLDAVKMYDSIDKLLTEAGYQRFGFQNEMLTAKNALIEKGFDPDAEPGSGPAGNTSTSWSSDPEGQKWSDSIQLKCVVEKKKPMCEKFVTPSFHSGERTSNWRGWGLDGKGPEEMAGFKPFGKEIKMSREGGTILMMYEGLRRPQELKLISQPKLVEMKTDYKDWDGNTQKLRYAWMACTGGPQEPFFGEFVNSSPGPTSFGIRRLAACYLKGKVLGQDVMIFDDNSTGRFGDPLPVTERTTSLGQKYMFNDAMIVGGGKIAAPWTEYLEVKGDFYRLKLDPENYSIKTRKLDVDTGEISVKFKQGRGAKAKPLILVVQETQNLKGAYFQIGKKPVTVPVGTYRFSYGIIRHGTKKSQQSCMILPGKFVSFQVRKGAHEVIEMGAPFSFDFEIGRTTSGSKAISGRSVVVYGQAGELYTRFHDTPVVPDEVSIRVKDGGMIGKPRSMEKATFGNYKQDTLSIWQPLNMVIPGDPGKTYQIRMKLDKHPLIGGPIESEWKSG